MIKIISLTNKDFKLLYPLSDKDGIIAEQKALGYRLVEVQKHIDGNHIIFIEEGKEYIPNYPSVIRNYAQEIDELKARITNLETAT